MPVALVTGSSRGIGRAIALALAREGYDLFLTARDIDNLGEVTAAVAATGRMAVGSGADLAAPEAPQTLFEAFSSAYDRLDLLVNNAGIAVSAPFGSYTAADWERVMNVNARSPFFLTQLCLDLLKRARPGVVVNVASVVAKKGYELQSLYAASKHALLGFTKSLARETVGDDVRVHAILPGGVNTRLVTGVRPDIDTSELIAPDEVAQVVVDLVRMRGNAVIDEIEIRRRSKTPWA